MGLRRGESFWLRLATASAQYLRLTRAFSFLSVCMRFTTSFVYIFISPQVVDNYRQCEEKENKKKTTTGALCSLAFQPGLV